MTYSYGELQEILKKHELWLDDEEGDERAKLEGADLTGAKGLISPSDFMAADLEKNG